MPEAAELDGAGWAEVEALVETALAARPASDRRRLALFLRVLRWLPVPRHGRALPSLPLAARTRILTRLQDSPLAAVRRGVWGVRTLAFLGYYGRPGAAAAIGYRADPRGWEARE